MKPLEGIRVLDLTRLLPGAVATQWMASHGAEVIKIEEPGEGDHGRRLPEVFEATNRGKLSITLNLKDSKDRATLLQMAARADVLVEGNRPGVMARLGLAYEQMENPGLIYVSLTGYGPDGDMAQEAGHDINYLAMSGVLDFIRDAEGRPVIPAFQAADIAGGSMQVVQRVMLALFERTRTGLGQHLECSMTAGLDLLLTLPRAMPDSQMLAGRYAFYNVYQARDGRWMAVGALEVKFWANLCRELGCEDLLGDQYAAEPRQSEVKRRIAERFRQRTADQWTAALRGRDVCVTAVIPFAEASGQLHGAWPAAEGDVPRLGEHNHLLGQLLA